MSSIKIVPVILCNESSGNDPTSTPVEGSVGGGGHSI